MTELHTKAIIVSLSPAGL